MLIRRIGNHLEISASKKEYIANKNYQDIYFSDNKSPLRFKVSDYKFKELEEELKTIPENQWYEIVNLKGKYFLFE